MVEDDPESFADLDGHDVTYQNDKLRKQTESLGAQSPSLKHNEQGSQGDTTVDTTNPQKTKITIAVDPYRTSDQLVEHEWGHEHDVRDKGSDAWNTS